jgi:hypothetical protein
MQVRRQAAHSLIRQMQEACPHAPSSWQCSFDKSRSLTSNSITPTTTLVREIAKHDQSQRDAFGGYDLQNAVTSFPAAYYERFLKSNRFSPDGDKAGSLCATALVHISRKRCSRPYFYVEETWVLELEKRYEHVLGAMTGAIATLLERL